MNINRNNYEEYFLMYADNELSQAEKKEVELFVQQNEYLEDEFKMIQLTINIPDVNVGMADKSFLRKNDYSSFINGNNYEEIFVLYHDNELANEQKIETEAFVKQHPNTKIEFELIGKAKLASDAAIVFPDKKQLYRKEKAGRVISLILWRSMAAAVFIGFGLWGGISYFSQKPKVVTVAFEPKNNQASMVQQKSKIEAEDSALSGRAIAPAEPKDETKSNEDNGQEMRDSGEMRIPSENRNPANGLVQKKVLPEERSIQITEDQPAMFASNNAIEENAGKMIATTNLPVAKTNEHVDRQILIAESVPYAQNASYTIDNNNNRNDDNYVFYNVKADEFNKSKVGGFLKKVKRIVERTNPIARIISGEDRQMASK